MVVWFFTIGYCSWLLLHAKCVVVTCYYSNCCREYFCSSFRLYLAVMLSFDVCSPLAEIRLHAFDKSDRWFCDCTDLKIAKTRDPLLILLMSLVITPLLLNDFHCRLLILEVLCLKWFLALLHQLPWMSSVLTSMFHAEVRLSPDVCGRASTPMVECRPPEGHLGHCTGTSTPCGCASPDDSLIQSWTHCWSR